jgi:hypothetical protein
MVLNGKTDLTVTASSEAAAREEITRKLKVKPYCIARMRAWQAEGRPVKRVEAE